MLKFTIKKSNGDYLDHSNFETEQAAMEWFQPKIDSGFYGKKAYSYQNLVAEAAVDENGVETSPAVYETINVPAEFTIESEDVTSQINQEAINTEALAYLNATDYFIIREVDAGTPCPAEIKAERAAARARIVN